jgi:type VI secretion system secreted protein VgrG
MGKFSQKTRLLSVSTTLGEDVLLLTGFAGREELSRLFHYQLDMVSDKDDIGPSDLVGKGVTWMVDQVDKAPRYFNGFVNRFAAGGKTARGLRAYRVEVVPWLWFLTRTANCKIFQGKTAKKIIEDVFDAYGFKDYKITPSRTPATRDYCVQYRETALNFVSRLMEEEGMFYFFKHENGKHTLMVADAKSAYADCPENEVAYTAGDSSPNHISSWDHQYEYRSGAWTQTDYNFETPSTDLKTNTSTVIDLPNIGTFEVFDYPGLYGKTGDGTPLTKIRMEEDETPYNVAMGASSCCTFTPAGKFTLSQHPSDAENKEYALTGIQHSATDTTQTNTDGTAQYNNTFACIPSSIVFRPARLTLKPFVQGPQTAVVVGKSKEEIYTDKYARVKVQFFWDRDGKNDENSSCWIRVAELWAGAKWGIVFNPRIGQEVVVDFLEGDPDRPLITGRVYNAEQMPPYELPTNQTQSGIKTRSSKDGKDSNFNELRFEDKKGSEEIVLHAERNLSETVEVDQTIQVFHNRSLTVGGGKNNSDPKKDGTLTETIEGDVSITVQKGDYTLVVQKGQMSVTAKKGISWESQDKDVSIKAKTQIKLEVGSSSLLMKDDGTIELKGTKVTIEGSDSVTVKPAAITLDGQKVKISGATIDILASGPATLKGAVVKINC